MVISKRNSELRRPSSSARGPRGRLRARPARRCAAPERASCVFVDRSGDRIKQPTTLPAALTFDERDLISDRVIVLWDGKTGLVGREKYVNHVRSEETTSFVDHRSHSDHACIRAAESKQKTAWLQRDLVISREISSSVIRASPGPGSQCPPLRGTLWARV